MATRTLLAVAFAVLVALGAYSEAANAYTCTTNCIGNTCYTNCF